MTIEKGHIESIYKHEFMLSNDDEIIDSKEAA